MRTLTYRGSYARLVLATAVGVGAFGNHAHADTAYKWNVAGSGNWQDAANWSPNGVPIADYSASTGTGSFDNATFNNTGVNADLTVLMNAGRSIAGMTFNNTGSTTLAGGTTTTTRTLNLRGPITVNAGAGPVTIGSSTTTGRVTINPLSSQSYINNSSNTVFFWNQLESPGASGILREQTFGGTGLLGAVKGSIQDGASGFTGVRKTGLGTWEFNSNTFTGGTIIDAGTILINHDNAFGGTGTPAATKTLTFNAGTVAAVNADHTVPFTVPVIANGDFSLSGKGFRTSFAAGVTINGSRTVTVGSGGSSWGGGVAGGGLTKQGTGDLTLSVANSYSGGTTVNEGLLVAGHEDALGTGSLTINNSSVVQAKPGLAKALDPSSFALAGDATPTAKLDLTNNALVVRNATLATHTLINAQVKNAFNEFAWDQPGITSSTAASDIQGGAPKTLGILFNNDTGGSALFYGNGGDLPLFQGRSVDANAVLVKYTLLGDGDLNGTVDSVDFALFQAGFDNSAPYIGFAFGDYNYDGSVDSVDFGLFQAGFDASNPLSQPTLSAAIADFAAANGLPLGAAAVPEPGSLGLLGLAAAGLLSRRRKG